MTKHLFVALAVGMLVAGLAASTAQAQDQAGVVANIPFEFTAGGREFAAGHYEFLFNGWPTAIVEIHSQTEGTTLFSAVVRRFDNPDTQAEVVFDVVGTRHYLSEIKDPGMDGVELTGAPGEHSHTTLSATRSR
ncbi:MAG TPA: hypothetical protein VMT45_03010 [Thermoanaerobaculaceae bacterium]|nr:hypothetical protein [Thermoanaerobaculaceae bacterium]